MNHTSDADTRVMSQKPNDGVLMGVITPCLKCGADSYEPSLCTNCGEYGHATCLNLEYFQGYPFCGGCLRLSLIHI